MKVYKVYGNTPFMIRVLASDEKHASDKVFDMDIKDIANYASVYDNKIEEIKMDETIKIGDVVEYKGTDWKVKDTSNDPSSKWVNIEKAGCVFPDEEWVLAEKVNKIDSPVEDESADNPPTIEVEYLSPYAGIESHGNWHDIKLPIHRELKLEKGKYYELGLGIKVLLPKGYEAHVLPRSSTFRKYGLILANSMGLIDEDYTLEWNAFFYASKDTILPPAARLVQFSIVPTCRFNIKTVVSLSRYTDRGESGSSGV